MTINIIQPFEYLKDDTSLHTNEEGGHHLQEIFKQQNIITRGSRQR